MMAELGLAVIVLAVAGYVWGWIEYLLGRR